MAAITRALLPQNFVQSLPSLARLFIAPTTIKSNKRHLSATSRLQPTFPEKPDEALYENATDEYDALEAPNVRHFTKSYPCDALARAATKRNIVLATSLIQEYQAAEMNIVHRRQYEILANMSLSTGDFESYLLWLSLVPAATNRSEGPGQSNVVKLLTEKKLLINECLRVLSLYARKGWSRRVMSDLVAVLAQYMPPKEFDRIFHDTLELHKQQYTDPELYREHHAIMRTRAVQELARRNQTDMAFDIFRESPEDVLHLSQVAVLDLYHSARRNGSSFIGALLEVLPPAVREQLQQRKQPTARITLTNTTLAQDAFRLQMLRGDTTFMPDTRPLYSYTAALLGALKWTVVGRDTSNTVDPKAIAFFLYQLTQIRNPRVIDLMRRRISRLGTLDHQTLWATVEMELLCYQNDAHSAIQYYSNAFLPLATPSFIQHDAKGRWAQWLSMKPKRTPPLPPKPLRPSSASLMAVWKSAIMLSLRDPPSSNRPPTTNEITASMDEVDQEKDLSYLVRLFIDFVEVYDHYRAKRRAFFSNEYTQARFFELFLRHFIKVDPEKCTWVMQYLQQRNIRLDHRIWAIYAKAKVDRGEPQYMLRVFELLERENQEPINFSPEALWDLTMMGKRVPKGGSEADVLIPQKVFNAYVYGFRQLVVNRAFKEAAALHQRIIDAGYREGTSLPLDRLVHSMLDGMRPYTRRVRLRYEEIPEAFHGAVADEEFANW